MKALILMSVLLICLGSAMAQEVRPDSLYILTYTTGPSWDTAKLPNEQPYFKEHSANPGKLMCKSLMCF